ncbi:MAG: hypothetical protein LBD58_02425, partial [Treponema sp.]|nr:hypothetical protein [Treponema sp.]
MMRHHGILVPGDYIRKKGGEMEQAGFGATSGTGRPPPPPGGWLGGGGLGRGGFLKNWGGGGG